MSGAGVRAFVVLASVFALGALAGVFVDRHLVGGSTMIVRPAEDHEAMMAELREELQLDEEQAARIEELIAARQHVVQQAWEQLRPEVQAVMREIHVQMGEILRPEQVELFHDWLVRQRDRHQNAPLH